MASTPHASLWVAPPLAYLIALAVHDLFMPTTPIVWLWIFLGCCIFFAFNFNQPSVVKKIKRKVRREKPVQSAERPFVSVVRTEYRELKTIGPVEKPAGHFEPTEKGPF